MRTTDADAASPAAKTAGQAAPSSAGAGVSIRVLWTVTAYKAGEGAVMGNEEAAKMLFKPLDIGSTYITFDGKTCGDVVFQKTQVEARGYLDRVYHVTPQALGIDQESLEVVQTDCSLPGFAEYLRLKRGRIIIHVGGVFFFFEPAVNY
ncbi:MAG: hypothetical protein ACYC7J_20925 [Syntrophales bacterium]